MNGTTAVPGIGPAMVEERDAGGRLRTQRWHLPTETGFVHDFIVDIFQRYWDRLTFGPILDGIAYELTCPCAPDRFELSGGYLIVMAPTVRPLGRTGA